MLFIFIRSNKTTGDQPYRRDLPSRVKDLSNQDKSESMNINKRLELTEENLKQHDENYKELEREEEYEFYSNIDEGTPQKKEIKLKQ